MSIVKFVLQVSNYIILNFHVIWTVRYLIINKNVIPGTFFVHCNTLTKSFDSDDDENYDDEGDNPLVS